MNDQSPDLDLSTSADATRGPISRRTVLAGTAFAVPAIVLTAGTPALAASGVSLSFNRGSYSGQGCSTISAVQISAKDGGTAKAGVAVTVSLADGYTFSTGGTTYTDTTNSSGSITLPDINVPQNGATSTAVATASGASTATATLTGTAAQEAIRLENGVRIDATGVPAGSTPIGGNVFLTSDKKIIDGGNNGALITTDVVAYGQIYVKLGNDWVLPLRKSDGTCVFAATNSVEVPTTGVPAGSTPVAGLLFLSPDNRIIRGDNGAVLATAVQSWGQMVYDGQSRYIALKKTNGINTYLADDTEHVAINVPAGSTPATSATFLTSDKRLVEANSGYLLASDVAAFGQMATTTPNKADWYIPVRKSDGTCILASRTYTEASTTGVPSGSTPLAHTLFLTSDKRIIDGLNGNVLATKVIAEGSYYHPFDQNYWTIPLNRGGC